MKHLIFNNGGQPIKLDDFEALQDLTLETLKALLLPVYGSTTPLAADSFRLIGAGVTDNGASYSYTSGYICLEGEVLEVNGGSIAKTGGHTYYWEKVTVDDSPRTFESAGSFACQTDVFARLTSSASPPADYMPMEADYYLDLIQKPNSDRLDVVEGVWTGFTPTFNTADFTMSSSTCKYRLVGKTMDVMMRIEGSFASGSAGLNIYIPASKEIVATQLVRDICGITENGVGRDHATLSITQAQPDQFQVLKNPSGTFASGAFTVGFNLTFEIA